MAGYWPTFELLIAKLYSNLYPYLLDLIIFFGQKSYGGCRFWVAGLGQSSPSGGSNCLSARSYLRRGGGDARKKYELRKK
jgi:hypothetical protein